MIQVRGAPSIPHFIHQLRMAGIKTPIPVRMGVDDVRRWQSA